MSPRPRHEGVRDAVRLLPPHATDQVDTHGDVPPLVAAAHLESTSVALIQLNEVVCLEESVAELRVGDPGLFVLNPPPHGLLLQERVHGEVLANVTQEVDHGDLAEPVQIVDRSSRVGGAFEIEKVLQLPTGRRNVIGRLLLGE